MKRKGVTIVLTCVAYIKFKFMLLNNVFLVFVLYPVTFMRNRYTLALVFYAKSSRMSWIPGILQNTRIFIQNTFLVLKFRPYSLIVYFL